MYVRASPLLLSFEKSKIFDHPGVITAWPCVLMTFSPPTRLPMFSFFARSSIVIAHFEGSNGNYQSRVSRGFYIGEPRGWFFGYAYNASVCFGETDCRATGGLYTLNDPPSQFTDSDRVYWIRLFYEIKKLIGPDGCKNHHAFCFFSFFFTSYRCKAISIEIFFFLKILTLKKGNFFQFVSKIGR